MKKQTILIIMFASVFVITLSVIFTLSMCSRPEKKMECPQNIQFDDTYKLSWEKVENAKSYVIEVKNITDENNVTTKEYTTKRLTYSLDKLDVGDYEIRVKAVSPNPKEKTSWSDIIEFRKNYETGCVYNKINNDTEYEIKKVGIATGVVHLEDEYRGKPVVSIADSAFKGSSRIKEIYIGDNITHIGDDAFYNCSKLSVVQLPKNLTYMGVNCFQACRSLEKIDIPESLTKISEYAFYYCRALNEVNFSKNITIIEQNAFNDCDSLTTITLPESLTEIRESAFAECDMLESVKANKKLKTIGVNAFIRCIKLKDFTIEDNSELESIGGYAFSYCDELQNINLQKGLISIDEYAFVLDGKLANIDIPETVTQIGRYAFKDTKLQFDQVENGNNFIYAGNWLVYVNEKGQNKTLTDANFKDNTVGIADNVFFEDSVLASVTFSENFSLKYIGKSAFFSCTKLGKFRANRKLVSIGDYAFAGCWLNQLLINSFEDMQLESIGNYAFYKTSVDNSTDENIQLLPDSIKQIGTYAFNQSLLWNNVEKGVVYAGNWVVGCVGVTGSVTLKAGTRGISDYAFAKSQSLSAVGGLENVKYIGYAAFTECSNLVIAPISPSITKISDYAFYKCTKLSRVTFNDTLEEIGVSAFSNCQSLQKVDLSNTMVHTIGAYAFSGCSSLNSVELNNGFITKIGNGAFKNNFSIKNVDIPDSVQDLGEKAFIGCAGLESVTIGSSLSTIKSQTFADCASLTEIVIPDNITEIGYRSFYNCVSATNVTMSNNLESIGNYAFYGMNNVQTLNIPKSVKSIGSYAFKDWHTITEIKLNSSVEVIGAHAFYGCKRATIYTDASEMLGKWHNRFNSSNRPIVWGVTFSEEGYLQSVTINNNTFSHKTALDGFASPVREGYEFSGWSLTKDSNEVTYTADQITQAPKDSTLYAVWIKK